MTLVAVGIGSVLFHMTLSYEMQLLDEVPMIYGTAAIGYCLCQVSCQIKYRIFGIWQKATFFLQIHSPVSKDSANWPLALFLLVYCLTFTAFYLRYKNPYIHEVGKVTTTHLGSPLYVDVSILPDNVLTPGLLPLHHGSRGHHAGILAQVHGSLCRRNVMVRIIFFHSEEYTLARAKICKSAATSWGASRGTSTTTSATDCLQRVYSIFPPS